MNTGSVEERHGASVVPPAESYCSPNAMSVLQIARQVGDVEASDGAETVARVGRGHFKSYGRDDTRHSP
jgi:hypothetical protein